MKRAPAIPYVAVVLAGACANLALLALPLLASGGRVHPRLLLFWALATFFCIAEGLAAGQRVRLSAPTAGPAMLTPLLGLVLLTVFLLGVFEVSASAAPYPALWAGAPIMLVGVGLRVASIRALGKRFASEVRLVPGHELVETGPYALARHPSEAGTLLVALGAAILLASPLAFAMTVAVLAPAVLYRTRLEDRMLASAFGGSFHEYARRVPALLPTPWRRSG